MYNIPQSIHSRVQRISQMDESQYEAFLATLEEEALSYIELSTLISPNEIPEAQLQLLISFYVQYTMFSKLENEEVASDKLKTLDRLLKTINEKGTTTESVRKAKFL